MKPVNNHKYLVSSEKDQTWGITVDTVGSESVAAGYETYPPRVGHPSGFYFDVGKGRVLESYQLLYITSGRGSFYGPDRKRIGIGAGDMVLLRPNRWHSYMPDRETGWHEYWIGFRGPNIDARFRNDFFDDSREVFRVGVREEITALYDKAIEVAENERSSYQQYLAGIANLLLGMTMYYHANHQFVSLDVVRQIDRARRIMREEALRQHFARRGGPAGEHELFVVPQDVPRLHEHLSGSLHAGAAVTGGLPPVVGNGHEHQGDRLPAQLRRRLLFFQYVPPPSADDSRRVPPPLRRRQRRLLCGCCRE